MTAVARYDAHACRSHPPTHTLQMRHILFLLITSSRSQVPSWCQLPPATTHTAASHIAFPPVPNLEQARRRCPSPKTDTQQTIREKATGHRNAREIPLDLLVPIAESGTQAPALTSRVPSARRTAAQHRPTANGASLAWAQARVRPTARPGGTTRTSTRRTPTAFITQP